MNGKLQPTPPAVSSGRVQLAALGRAPRPAPATSNKSGMVARAGVSRRVTCTLQHILFDWSTQPLPSFTGPCRIKTGGVQKCGYWLVALMMIILTSAVILHIQIFISHFSPRNSISRSASFTTNQYLIKGLQTCFKLRDFLFQSWFYSQNSSKKSYPYCTSSNIKYSSLLLII